MKRFLLSLLSLICLPMLSQPALALTFMAADNVEINEAVDDDLYVMGGNVTIGQNISGDLYLAGGQVIIEGNIEEDLVVTGGKILIYGDVIGDLRVAGGQVTVFGSVGDDLLVAGGQVDIGKDAVINGTVAAGAGLLTIDGLVREDVRGGMGTLFLYGNIDGDVVVTVEDSLQISDKAKIGGDLVYSSLLESSVPNGVVAGEVNFNQFEEKNVLGDLTAIFLAQRAFSFVGAFLMLLIIVLLAPKALVKAGQITQKNVIKTFVVGLLSIIGIFIGFFLLMVTLVGIPIGMIVLGSTIVIFYLAKLFACAWITSYFVNYKRKVKKSTLIKVLSLVLLAYYVVSLVPFVGWLVNFVLFVIGVGALLLTEVEYWKFLRSKNML